VICELLNKGTCVGIADIAGLTPLNLTAGSGYVISVCELLTCGCTAHTLIALSTRAEYSRFMLSILLECSASSNVLIRTELCS
jgi:hypothetical protein